MVESTAAMGAVLRNPAADPETRKLGIGGSDIAVICGLNSYRTPLDLYLEKTGRWVDEAASEAAHWGTVMEPVLAREYVKRFDIPVARLEEIVGEVVITPDYEIVSHPSDPKYPLLRTLVHPRHPWARGHVDGLGLAGDDPSHLAEFKTASEYLKGYWGDPDTDHVPDGYLVQVQWYLELTGLDLAHVFALIGGNRAHRYIIERDDLLIKELLERGEEFWERIQTENPPPPEEGEAGKESLKRMYPRHSEKEIDATHPNNILHQLAIALHEAREAEKESERRRITVENQVKTLLADASRVNLGARAYVSWKCNRDSTVIDWQSAVDELVGMLALGPKERREFLDRFTTEKPGARVFRSHGLDKLFTNGGSNG